MRRDRFSFSRPLEKKELREDSHGFQEDGKGPHDLGEREFIVEQ